MMKAKDYLMQVKKIDKMIENKIIEKDQWFAIATGINSSIGDDRVQSSGSQQKMADAVCKIADIERDIDRLVDQFIDTKQDVIRTIEMLPADEYDVIHKIYIQGMAIKDAGDAVNKSYKWTREKHGWGLKKIQDYIDQCEKK